jgi:hypothetical protein
MRKADKMERTIMRVRGDPDGNASALMPAHPYTIFPI